jgi:uncharacterized membrane protein YdbT with pleckstrin-like domain
MGRDEVLLYEGNVSLVGFYALLASFGAVLLIVTAVTHASRSSAEPVIFTAVVGGLTCLIVYASLSATELGITNRRVIAKVGVISRKVIEVRNDKIEGIHIEQSIFGRIFNYGSIAVSGSGQTIVPLLFIADPLAFRRAVDEVAGR